MNPIQAARFREMVKLVFQKMRPGVELTPTYLDDIVSLQLAGGEWYRERAPQFGPAFFKMPDIETYVLLGGLDLANSLGLCGNEAARDFVTFTDEKTNRRCTLFMLQIIVCLQQFAAVQRREDAAAQRRN